jgi:uncharacterized protein YcaQ
MAKQSLSRSDARKIILHAAGLSKRAQFGRGKEAVYKVIDHMGWIQVDTNYVVERAHHHQLASRVPGYRTEWLSELQAEGKIFEFWTSDAAFLPMKDFRFSLPVKEAFVAKRKPMTPAELNLMNRILDRISREGPLMAKDFEDIREKKSSGWWDWRPSKVAIEQLYWGGRLGTTRTPEFHKVYDLADNLVPRNIDKAMPTPEEFGRHVVRRSLRSMGIAHLQEIMWSSRFVRTSVKDELMKLIEEGEVSEVTVEGIKGLRYMFSSYLKKKIKLSNEVFVLSPFDRLNFFRRRLREYFDFDYQIECFVPKAKRKYGYFSLPILAGDKFVARMDSKAERKEKKLIVFNLHFEDVKMSNKVAMAVWDAIEDFAEFNGCKSIEIEKTNRKNFPGKERKSK